MRTIRFSAVVIFVGLTHGLAHAQSCGWSDVSGGLTGNGASDTVRSMTVYDEVPNGAGVESLFVGGSFDFAGGVPASQIARWDGSAWSSVGGGLDKSARWVTTYDLDDAGPMPELLYAAGDFTIAGGVAALGIASWDGTTWAPLGSGIGGQVWAMLGYDVDGPGPISNKLYVGGEFTSAGGMPASQIACWDGFSWSEVGGGVASSIPGNLWPGVYTFGVWDADGAGPQFPLLIVAGGFNSAGGTPASLIATWNGNTWGTLGAGVGGANAIPRVRGVVPFDEDGPGGSDPALFAAGVFSEAGGVEALRVARWDGAAWSDVAGGVSGNEPNTDAAGAVHVHDEDGDGPMRERLFVGGKFLMAGAASSKKAVAWDGTEWGSLAGGLEGSRVICFGSFDEDGPGGRPPSFFAGGEVTEAGGVAINRIARWTCCYADCDQSGSLDFFDFVCFQERFLIGDMYTDCDASGGLDFFDFFCFINKFNDGCF